MIYAVNMQSVLIAFVKVNVFSHVHGAHVYKSTNRELRICVVAKVSLRDRKQIIVIFRGYSAVINVIMLSASK